MELVEECLLFLENKYPNVENILTNDVLEKIYRLVEEKLNSNK